MDLEVIPSTCRNNQPTWISPHHLTGDLNNTKHIQSVNLWTELGIAEPTKILNKQQFEKKVLLDFAKKGQWQGDSKTFDPLPKPNSGY